jgi:lipopolysaccharide biosynthesis regulator YciM
MRSGKVAKIIEAFEWMQKSDPEYVNIFIRQVPDVYHLNDTELQEVQEYVRGDSDRYQHEELQLEIIPVEIERK